MKYKSKSLIIVGAWNKYVLTEEWVRTNILPQTEYSNVSVEIPMNVDGSLKFNTKDFSFYIITDKLVFIVNNNDDNSVLIKISQVARSLLRLLLPTPLKAFGVNFVCLAAASNDELKSISNTEEVKSIVKAAQCLSSFTRSFVLSENETLNLTQTFKDGSLMEYDFNFNSIVKYPIDIIERLGDDDEYIFRKQDMVATIIGALCKE